jgi:hypothetical protein
VMFLTYTNCSGYEVTISNPNPGSFLNICACNATVTRVSFWRDNVQYTSSGPYPWVPLAPPLDFYSFNVNNPNPSTPCFGEPCR